AHLADEVGVAARCVDGGRVALDREAAPPQAEHLFDDDALAAARVRESAVEHGYAPRTLRACPAFSAHEQEPEEAEHQRIAGGDRVIKDDGPGRDRRAQA